MAVITIKIMLVLFFSNICWLVATACNKVIDVGKPKLPLLKYAVQNLKLWDNIKNKYFHCKIPNIWD